MFSRFVLSLALAVTLLAYSGYVSDFAGVLEGDDRVALSERLASFQDRSGIRLVVVTVLSLNGQTVAERTESLSQEWGLSGQDVVLFVTAPAEHRMRIQAMGVARRWMSNDKAADIVQNVVLPTFRGGDIPGGIKAGTFAIMEAFGQAPAEETDWTSIVVGILIIAVVFCLFIPTIRRRSARKYVLDNREALNARYGDALEISRNVDVKAATRSGLLALGNSVDAIEALNPEFIGVETRRSLDSVSQSIDELFRVMQREIAFAKKARTEGPRMLAELPAKLAAAEAKLREKGKFNAAAAAKLAHARELCEQGDAYDVDWVGIYEVLTQATQTAVSLFHEASAYVPSAYAGFGESVAIQRYDSGTTGVVDLPPNVNVDTTPTGADGGWQ